MWYNEIIVNAFTLFVYSFFAKNRVMARQKLKNPVGLNSLLQSLFQDLNHDQKLLIHRLQAQWDQVVGSELASKTHPFRLNKGGTLIISSKDSSWMTELDFRKEEIINYIKQTLPELGIKKIRYQLQNLTD